MRWTRRTAMQATWFAAIIGVLAACGSDGNSNSVGELLTEADALQIVEAYYAAATAGDADYTEHLAGTSDVELLEVPMVPPLARWDSGLSILFNRCTHRKVLCADGGVPDVSVADLSRARRKLDLYRMVLGREGEDRCWLVGFNGYEEILGLANAGPDDILHPLLQAAGRAGLDVSLLDTKRTLADEPDMDLLRGLARREGYPRLRTVLARHRLDRKGSGAAGAD